MLKNVLTLNNYILTSCLALSTISSSVVDAAPHAFWREEIKAQVDARSGLKNMATGLSYTRHHSPFFNSPLLSCSILKCFFEKNHHYVWLNIREGAPQKILLVYRTVLPQLWGGQRWFVGAYGGLKLYAFETYSLLSYVKEVVGFEWAGSNIGQLSVTGYRNKENTSGISLEYATPRLFDKFKLLSFMSLSQFYEHDGFTDTTLRFGMGCHYWINSKWQAQMEYMFFSPDPVKELTVRLQYTVQDLGRDVFRSDFLREPNCHVPFSVDSDSDYFGAKTKSQKTYSSFNTDASSKNSLEEEFSRYIGQTPEVVKHYSANDLQKAYRKASIKIHPDKASSDKRAKQTKIFQDFNEIFNLLLQSKQ